MSEFNSLFHRVKITQSQESFSNTEVYIDDLPVKASMVDVHMEYGCIHQTDIKLNCEPDLEYTSLVTFDFSPKTIKTAVDVLKIALKRNDFIAYLGLDSLNKILEEKND